MEGFIVFDYEKQYPHAIQELAQWLAEGKIKRLETVIKGGITKMPEALRALYEGANTGMSNFYLEQVNCANVIRQTAG